MLKGGSHSQNNEDDGFWYMICLLDITMLDAFFVVVIVLLHARHEKEGFNFRITAYVLFRVLICSNARLAYVCINGKRHAHLSVFLSLFFSIIHLLLGHPKMRAFSVIISCWVS